MGTVREGEGEREREGEREGERENKMSGKSITRLFFFHRSSYSQQMDGRKIRTECSTFRDIGKEKRAREGSISRRG